MGRKLWIVCGAVCVLAFAVWMIMKSSVSDEKSPSSETTPPSISPLTHDSQSPRISTEPGHEIIAAEDSIQASSPAPASAPSEPDSLVELNTVDETLDEYARLVGERYDLLLQTMDEHEASIYAHDQISLEIIKGKHPRLFDAIRRFQGQFPPESRSPGALLARAGRIPNENLWTLPNGEVVEVQPNTEVVVTFYKRGKITAEGLRKLEASEKEEREILDRLEAADVSEEERASLQTKLEETRQFQKTILEREPSPFEITRIHGDREDPDFKTIRINVGIVD
ncbi:MAG: hypothetical protein OXT69_06630 [Candidatus Poribacteria bacterium]|nr:hypothetical protein [Candidatus Poribacteria bacterium]